MSQRRSNSNSSRSRSRGGQALVEFGIISLLAFTFVIGILTYGIQLWSAVMLQQAVDQAATAASRTPLPPDKTFAEALDDEQFLDKVYNPRWLVVTPNELGNMSFDEFMADKPIVNRLLSPLMVRDDSIQIGGAEFVFRYPGTVVTYVDFLGDTRHTVLVPVLSGRGSRQISWRFPVEEITEVVNGNEVSVFTVVPEVGAETEFRGLAALRINYPFQTPAAFGIQYVDAGGSPIAPGEAPVAGNDWIFADESITADPLPSAFTFAQTGNPRDPNFQLFFSSSNGDLGPFSGQYGLGRLIGADGFELRPYRHVMTFQAIRIREMFR